MMKIKDQFEIQKHKKAGVNTKKIQRQSIKEHTHPEDKKFANRNRRSRLQGMDYELNKSFPLVRSIMRERREGNTESASPLTFFPGFDKSSR